MAAQHQTTRHALVNVCEGLRRRAAYSELCSCTCSDNTDHKSCVSPQNLSVKLIHYYSYIIHENIYVTWDTIQFFSYQHKGQINIKCALLQCSRDLSSSRRKPKITEQSIRIMILVRVHMKDFSVCYLMTVTTQNISVCNQFYSK